MNRDPTIRHRVDRKYDVPEFDRMRPQDGRMMNDQYTYNDRGPQYPQTEYRTLCISNLNPKVPDHIVSQALYEEYAPFGDFNVKIVHQGDHRIAYVNFRFAEDARAAKHSRRPGNFMLFDMPVRVDSVIHNRRPAGDGFNRESWGRGGHSPGASQAGGRRYDRDYYSDGSGQYSENYRGSGEYKDHKFPHHLNHIDPEDDEMATRTLFVGNLDNNIGDDELRGVFNRFGIVEEIDIKYPAKQGHVGNAYAFIKMINLDMAHRAKVEMSGKYIGKYQCKIGYGKVTPTNIVWVGGLGPWVTLETLEQEFDRFGAIKMIEWQQSKNYGFVVYDNADAAQAASTEMRGFPIGGPEHRLRVDFGDESHLGADFGPLPPPISAANRPSSNYGSPPSVGRPDGQWRDDRTKREWSDGYRGNDRDNGDRRFGEGDARPFEPTRRDVPAERGPEDFQRDNGSRKSFSPPPAKRRRSSTEGSGAVDQIRDDKSVVDMGNAAHVDNILDFSKCLPIVWNGALVLKSSAFATRMHLVSGNVHLVDNLMRDPTSTEMSILKITQRLRLDPPKLDEVSRRVTASGEGGYAVLLAMPGSTEALDDAGSARNVQQRPLKNLVSYLKQKEAAGVISLPPNPGKDKENIGVLHSFPPCPFANDYLIKRAPKLKMDLGGGKEEHLVIVVVKGAALS